MENPQVRILDAVRATQRFLDGHRDALVDAELVGARRVLDAVEEQLSAHALVQLGSGRQSQEATARQRHLRKAMRLQYMKPIAAIARQNLRQVPQFSALRVPPSGMIGNKFIVAARDLASAAEAHASVFVAEGMPASFVERLRGLIDQLESSMVGRRQDRGKLVGATAGLTAESKRARVIFRVLDAIVRPVIDEDDPLVAAWDAATRLPRRVRSHQRPVETEQPLVTVESASPVAVESASPVAVESPSPVATPVAVVEGEAAVPTDAEVPQPPADGASEPAAPPSADDERPLTRHRRAMPFIRYKVSTNGRAAAGMEEAVAPVIDPRAQPDHDGVPRTEAPPDFEAPYDAAG